MENFENIDSGNQRTSNSYLYDNKIQNFQRSELFCSEERMH